jgi:hypothetical protein
MKKKKNKTNGQTKNLPNKESGHPTWENNYTTKVNGYTTGEKWQPTKINGDPQEKEVTLQGITDRPLWSVNNRPFGPRKINII